MDTHPVHTSLPVACALTYADARCGRRVGYARRMTHRPRVAFELLLSSVFVLEVFLLLTLLKQCVQLCDIGETWIRLRETSTG